MKKNAYFYFVFKHGVKNANCEVLILFFFFKTKQYFTEVPSLRMAAGGEGFLPLHPLIYDERNSA